MGPILNRKLDPFDCRIPILCTKTVCRIFMSPILKRKMDPSDCRIPILCTKYVCSFRMGPILNRELDSYDFIASDLAENGFFFI